MIADSLQGSPSQPGRRNPAKAPAFSQGIILPPRPVSKPGMNRMPEHGSGPASQASPSQVPESAPPAARQGRWRSVLALGLLAVVGSICFSLGLWQLERAAERDALHARIEHGRGQAALPLTARTSPTDLTPWRAASAQGHWSEAHTVLLENRNLEGRPGYWVATPLLLAPAPVPPNRHDAVSAGSAELGAMAGTLHADDFLGRGPAAGNIAVLVLRGWLPRDLQAAGTPPDLPQEPGLISVQGELHTHVPRIFELWQWAGGVSSALPDTLPQTGGLPAVVQNLDLAEYAQATGLRLLPAVLAQTQAATGTEAGTGASALRREWPGPSLDSDQNRGYALQWFSFSAIALIAALFVLRSLLRRRPKASSKEAS